jgi:hypothetical protein
VIPCDDGDGDCYDDDNDDNDDDDNDDGACDSMIMIYGSLPQIL